MSKPEPPQPPNPYDTARAATGTNVSTAVANAFLNNVNQVTPQGSLDYNQTGEYNWTDPSTGQTYTIPRFTATQTLSQQQQAIQGQTEAAQYNLAGMANAQSGRIAGLLSSNVDLSQAPRAGQEYWLAVGDPQQGYADVNVQGGLRSSGQQQRSFGEAGDITRSYGPADNFSADRSRVEEALLQRMNPQLKQQRAALEQRLADQGIRYGSQAYHDAMATYNQQENDARWGAVQQGGAEQQRMNAMAAQLAAFQNTAQGQAYAQAKERGEFANRAQEQDYQQSLGEGTFANQAAAQRYSQNAQNAQFYNQAMLQRQQQLQNQFNAANAARNQYMQEQYAYRNQPLNEISALLSGSQVNDPNFVRTGGSQIPTTDMAGIINQNYNQQMSAYQQQSANYNNLIGGVLGLGAGAIMRYSDERTKENVERVGTVFAFNEEAARRKLPIYEYEYKNDARGERHVGPMAQDVEKIDPGAVRHDARGYKLIDVNRVMGNILKAA